MDRRHILASVRRTWWVVLVGLLVAGGFGYLLATGPDPVDESPESVVRTPGERDSLAQRSSSQPTEPGSGAPFSYPGDGTAPPAGLARHGLSCARLPTYTGGSSVPAGTTISRQRITGPLDLSAGSITIEQSCFQPTSVGRGLPVTSTTNNNTGQVATSKVVIRDSEFDGSLLDQEEAAFSTAFIGVADLINNYVHGFGSGLAIRNAGEQLDARVEGNYVTGLVAWGDGATTGNHSSAFTVRDFTGEARPDRQLVVRGNRFDSSSGSDTGALFIQTSSGPIDNVLIEGNLLEGEGYQFGLEEKDDPYSNIRAIDNRATGTGWGAVYVSGGPGPSQWTDNYIYDADAADGRAMTIPRP